MTSLFDTPTQLGAQEALRRIYLLGNHLEMLVHMVSPEQSIPAEDRAAYFEELKVCTYSVRKLVHAADSRLTYPD